MYMHSLYVTNVSDAEQEIDMTSDIVSNYATHGTLSEMCLHSANVLFSMYRPH